MSEITWSQKPPDPQAYLALFETTGWNDMYRRSADELARAVSASWRLECAYEDDALVGVGRLVSDGVQYAVVFDMIVKPSHQGRGIGSRLLERLLEHCEAAGIPDVLLFAARGTEPFYRRHGFLPRPTDAPGMILRRV